ncbi:MAG: 50S ribosomal protein L6 [Proteobacteria bacterium]|nr:50S ribosomal protein L6 [Pseudomonadota bacterium]
MSRVGKNPITIPDGVTVSVDGVRVTVKGPKGEMARSFDPALTVAVDNGQVVVSRPSDHRRHRALHGLTRSLIQNMVTGVSSGYRKVLDIVGVGYRAELIGTKLNLVIGFSHPILLTPPEGITFTLTNPTQIVVEGVSKELVGELAAMVRKFRPPEPYKGKGIRYAGELVKRKAGKSAA